MLAILNIKQTDMKRVLIALLLVCFINTASFAQSKRVAILEPVDKANAIYRPVREKLRNYLSKSVLTVEGYEGYTGITASTIGLTDYEQIGLIQSVNIKDIASRANAIYILTTEIDKYDDAQIFVVATLYNGITGEKKLKANTITPIDDTKMYNNCIQLIQNLIGSDAVGGTAPSVRVPTTPYEGPSAPELYGLGKQYYDHGEYEKAVEYFRKAALMEDLSAQYMLAECLYYGKGTPRNYKEAVHWYQNVASKGDIDAQYSLGFCYYYGIGTAVDYEKAVEWLVKASAMGHKDAKYMLADCQFYGKGMVQNYKGAVETYLELAEAGKTEAQYSVGYCYFYGFGITRDYFEAVNWFRKAAVKGHTKSQYMLAECQFEGKGMIANKSAALEAFRKLANEGDADAQYSLGYYLYAGTGILHDVNEARIWLKKAADQGHGEAIELLKNIDK